MIRCVSGFGTTGAASTVGGGSVSATVGADEPAETGGGVVVGDSGTDTVGSVAQAAITNTAAHSNATSRRVTATTSPVSVARSKVDTLGS